MTSRIASAALALAALVSFAGCATTTAASSEPTEQPTLSDKDWEEINGEPADTGEADVKKWEKEEGIRSSDWYRYVQKREVKSGSLWIYTKLGTSGEAKRVASRICGAYAQYVFEDPSVTETYVRAKDGQRLAKCGPDA